MGSPLIESDPAVGTTARRMEQGKSTAPLGLYLHIPFCERKCPYCDFNTYAGLEAHHDAMTDALCGEMETWGRVLEGRPVHTVFVGGGTPTVLNATQLTRLFSTLRRQFQLTSDCEITCEANPGTVDRPKFQHLHSLGVNRLSLGVQSFQAHELEFLGRIHSVDDVFRAVEAARAAHFANINLDFIFGLPNQQPDDWHATLEQALSLDTEHLSLYSLIVEPNTPLRHWVESGRVPAPDDDCAADLYEYAMRRLAAAGFVHYEVSNWARAPIQPEPDSVGDGESEACSPYVSRHNLIYWRNQEYVGIGPGAHSHLRLDGVSGARLPAVDENVLERATSDTGEDLPPVSRRWSNRKPVPGYIKRVQAKQPVIDFAEELTAPVSMGESMMMGLRLVQEGVSFARFAAQHGHAVDGVFGREVTQLLDAGLLERTPQRIRVSARGLLLANQVAETFLAV